MRVTAIATARLTGIRPRTFGTRPRSSPLWTTWESFLTDATLFSLGIAGLWSTNIGGALPGCELLLIPLLPFLFVAQGKRAFDRQYLWFYLVVGGWLIGTLAADSYNDIVFLNRAKGTARVVFFAIDFMALAILLNNKTRRFLVFAASYAAVLFFSSWGFGDFLLRWKFGLSHSLTIAALTISVYYYSRKRYGICLTIALVIAGLNFRYGFRSQLLIDVVSTILTVPIFSGTQARANRPAKKQGLGRTILLLALAVFAANSLNAAFKYGASKKIFDESTNEKFVGQAKGDFGVLVGGRPETLVAIQAIIDSPIIGHGSFPFGLKYLRMEQDLQYQHGYSDSDEPDEVFYPVIPTHSHLTLAWVEGGILGGVCWIYIFILVLRAVLRLSVARPAFAPLYAYLLVNFLWDILYSPFGSVNRIQGAFFTLLSYFILRSTEAPGSKLRSPMEKMRAQGRSFLNMRRTVRPSHMIG